METIARTLSFLISCFALVNLTASFDANIWWIRFHSGFLAVTALLMIGYAVAPEMAPVRKGATLAVVCLLFVAAMGNASSFMVSSGRVPLTLVSAACLAIVTIAMVHGHASRMNWGICTAAIAGLVVAFPLAQMMCFGRTDYRRAADVAVVFGARTYSDGSPSLALADRMRTACDLHRRGLVHTLILSGGPGDGAIHETECMKRIAMASGVRESDIIIDAGGMDTRATVANTVRIHGTYKLGRMLAVSHSYHLPRVKVTFQGMGLEVFTVPARESRPLTKMPLFMAREVAAFWAYYVRAIV